MAHRRIIDQRNKEKFQVDDLYLNGYAKLCGIYATGVYMVLCRHSDKYQHCFPGIKLIAEKLGISQKSVKRAIQILEQWNIIQVERERTEDGTWRNNTYTLLDKSEWSVKPGDSQTSGHHGSHSPAPWVSQSSHHGSDIPRKEAHRKEGTYNGGDSDESQVDENYEVVSELDDGGSSNRSSQPSRSQEKRQLFSLFSDNPRPWWKHKQENEAALRLLDDENVGYDGVKRGLDMLRKNSDDPYCPRARTPYEFEKKLEMIIDYKNRSV